MVGHPEAVRGRAESVTGEGEDGEALRGRNGLASSLFSLHCPVSLPTPEPCWKPPVPSPRFAGGDGFCRHMEIWRDRQGG